MQDWAALIYQCDTRGTRQARRPSNNKQLAKINRARSYFRYPALDDEGYRAMRMESVVGWRDFKYPENVVYGQKSPPPTALRFRLPQPPKIPTTGYAQQLIDDGQFFASVDYQLTLRGMKDDLGLLELPDEYDTIRLHLI